MKKFFAAVIFACFFSSIFAVNLGSKFLLDFEIGATGAIDTRIVDQSDRNRSNFVFQDMLAGLDFTMLFGPQKKPFGAYAELTALYPLQHRFNTMIQKYANVMNFSVDAGLGGYLRLPIKKRFRTEALLGFHYNHLHEDRFLYNTFGINIGLGFGVITLGERKKKLKYEFEPTFSKKEVSKCAQAVMLRYAFKIDFADFGTNKNFEPLKTRYAHNIYLSYSF